MVDIVPGSERDVLIDALVEPPAQPGPLARGFGAGVAGVKSSLYGAGALAARGAANAATVLGATPVATYATGLEQAALTEAQALEEQAAAGSMRVEDVVEDPTRTIEFAKWALGNAAPSLLLMAAGGLAGRGLGALAAKRLPIAAKTAKTIGMYAGAVTPDVALEAGGIYPEALRTGVEDPALRAAAGGSLAGAVDFLTLPPQLRALLPRAGARVAAKSGFGAVAKSAALNAPKVGALEAAQELSQEMIGMAAAGVPLTGTEAMSRYLNAAAVGGIAGGAVGGVAGGIHGALGPTSAVQPTPVPMDSGQAAPVSATAEQAPIAEQPTPPGEVVAPAPLALTPEDRPLDLVPIPTAQEEAWNQYNALEDEVVRTGQALREANQQVEASAAGLKALGRRVPPAAKAAHEAVVAQAKAAQLALEELTPRLKTAKILAETPAALNPAIKEASAPVVSPMVAPSDVVATSTTPPTEAEQVTRAVEGVQALMREQGLITPAEDTSYQGNYDRIFKKVVEPVTGTARETVRAPDQQAQMKAVEPNAMAVIEPMAKSLAEAKTKTPGGRVKIAKAITASLRGVVKEAAKLDSVDAAQAYVLEKTPAALKGHGVLMDALDIAKAVSVAVGQARGVVPSGARGEPRLIGGSSVAHERVTKARNPALDTVWATLSIEEQTAIEQEAGREEFELAVVDKLEGNEVVAKRFLAKASDVVREAFRKIVAALMSLVVALHIGHVQDARALPLPTRQTVVQVQTIIEKPKAAFAGDEHSAMSEVVANWVMATNAHKGKAFVLADKAGGRVHAFSPSGKILGSAPALYGEALKDTMTPEQLAKPLARMTKADKITPAGKWTVALENSAEYGWLLDVKGGNGLAIHAVYLGTPSENRLGRLASATPSDNFVSWGCVNVPTAFARSVFEQNFTSQDHGLFILPIQTENTYKTFGIMEEDLMPNVDTEFRAVGVPSSVSKQDTPQGAVAGRLSGNAQGRVATTRRRTLNSRAAPLTQPEYDALPQAAKDAATDAYNRVMMDRGLEARARITQLLGDDPNLSVKTFQADPGSPIGMYTRVNKLKSVVAMALNAKDILGNADHEGFHYAEDRLLTGAERQIVANALKIGRPVFNQLLARVRQYDAENRTQLADEVASTPAEARAYAFEFWRRGELQAEGALARVFQKLQQFFERIVNLIRGLGFKSIEDVFVAFDRGQFAERTGREQNGLGEQDRLAARSSDYTNTPEFKRWFGDSKVVDAGGKPLVVYHGTHANIATFSEKLLGSKTKGGDAKAGFFFAENPKAAGEFIWYKGETSGGNIIPAYLSIRNPKVISDMVLDGSNGTAAGARLRTAKDAGYDGAIFEKSNMLGNEGRTYVAFRPEQIKSAIGNTGAFDPNNPDIRFSNDRASSWYRSALTEAVQGIASKQASAQGWKDQIKGLVQKGAVKQAEIDAVGPDEFLSLQKGRVTKDQLLAFLGENGVRVEEVVLGDTGDWTPADSERLDWLETNRDDLTDAQEAERGALVIRENAQSEPGGSPAITKFQSYQLPGGTNYRELLLTLPPKATRRAMVLRRAEGERPWKLYVEGETEHHSSYATEAEARRILAKYPVFVEIAPKSFDSPHFDQPNILAHIRFNERTDADGARVLFVEEFQSDWAQKGRKEGFANTLPLGWKIYKSESTGRWKVADEDGVERGYGDTKQQALEMISRSGVPSAPFVTNTEAWLGLSLKRMIRYAAENGFDKVAWTTGEQQVERYSSALRKAVDVIEWKKTPEGVHLAGYKGTVGGSSTVPMNVRVPVVEVMNRHDFLGFDTRQEALDEVFRNRTDWVTRWGDGLSVADQDAIETYIDARARLSRHSIRAKVVDTTESESVLSDTIGKSMADRIRNDPNQSGVIEGENITVSDTGMAGFYDRIVPNVVNGILKKLGGGRVGQFVVPIHEDWAGSPGQAFEAASVQIGLERGALGRQPGFTITPALATRAAEGLPLFSRAARDLGITPEMERQAIVDQTRQFAIGELPAEQYYQSITKLHDLADTRGTPRDLAKGVGADVVSKLWAARMPFATGNYIARFSKGYRNVMEVMLAQIRYKHSLIAEGSEAGLSAWHAGSQEDRDVVTDALIKRTVGGYLVGSAEYNEIRRLLETAGRLAMFDQANAQVKRFLEAEFEADKYTFKQLMSEEEYPVWEAARAEQVRNLIANGYIPEKRYGDHTVRIYADTVDKKGPKRVAVGVEHFETKREAVFRAEQIKQELAASGAELFVEVGDRYRAEHDSGISIQQFLDTARRHNVQITQAERERLSRALIAADSVQRNRMMRRRNVPGMSKAGYRIINEFVVTMANKVSHAKYSSAVNDALEGLPITITPAAEGPAATSVDRSGANFWVEDGAQAGFYRNLADSLADRVLSPTEGSEWSSKFKGLAMGYFLGGSLSAGLVQLFALPMNTLPWLSMHTSYGNAFVSSIAGLAMTVKNNVALRSLEALQDPTIRLDDVDAVPGLRAALIQAAKDGRTMDTEIFQIMGISRGGLLAQSRAVQKAMQVWMKPFRLGEQTSRIASFIAAYKVGLSNHLSGVELYKFAGSVVDNTQNQFNEVNRPAVATHPIWSLMFMFKSFPLFMVEMIELMYRQNPKSAVYMLLGLVAFTGVQGLPFAEDIEDLVDAISQKLFGSSFNSRRAMRNVMKDATEAFVGVDKSELLLRGAINDVLGFNIASRVGMGDLIPGTRVGSPDTDYSRTVEQILGAPFAMATAVGANAGKLFGGIAKGDMDQALAALRAGGPSAVRNVIKGVEQLNTGIAEDVRGRKLTDVSTWNALLQLGGLTSANLNKMYEMDKIDRQVTSYYTEMRTHMQDELVRAMKDGDQAKAQEVYDAMRKWTDANPDMPLMLNAASIRRQIMMAGIPLNQRSLLLMPKQLRGTSIAAEMVQ